MKTVTPHDFLDRFGGAPDCTDHHFTGPARNQQPENHGSVFHEEGQILFALARRHGPNVLEIGSDNGISTRYLYEGLPSGFVVAVDYNHKWGPDEAWPRRVRITMDTTRLDAADELRQFGPYSMAFIDGDHRYSGVINDIKIALALGIDKVFFHDTRPDMPIPSNSSNGSDVRKAVEDVFGDDKGWQITHITTGCGTTFVEEAK